MPVSYTALVNTIEKTAVFCPYSAYSFAVFITSVEGFPRKVSICFVGCSSAKFGKRIDSLFSFKVAADFTELNVVNNYAV